MDIKNGMLQVGETEQDFLIGGQAEIPPLFKQDNVRIEYTQGSTLHCTLYSSIGAVSDIFNYEFTKTEIQEVINLSVERGKPLNAGRYTQLGVKCVTDWWNNKYPDKKVLYFRTIIGDPTFFDVLSKGYTIVVSYKGNKAYNDDVADDAMLQGVEFPNPSYGHATTTIFMENGKVFIKDSYKGRKGKNGLPTNYYKLSDLNKLVENGVYYPACYFVIQESNTNKTEEQMKRLVAMKNEIGISMESHSKLWNLTNDQMFKDRMHEWNNILREKAIDIQNEINKLT